MKIVFMGTPEFAVPTLEKLYNSPHEVVAVVTKPDQKRGRGQKVTFSPVKEVAINHGTKVIQPKTVKGNNEFYQQLMDLNADAFVVVAYGKILPKKVLDIPPLGCINIHGSLLPKYRGAAPIHWALANGEEYTGVTTMLMDEGMDTGDILLKKQIKIEEIDNVDTLHKKLAQLGSDLLVDTLEGLKIGDITPIKQNVDEATYAPMVNKEMGTINWNATVRDIFNRIRGFNPWPGTFSYIDGQRIKIIEGEIFSLKQTDQDCANGTIVDIIKEGIVVKTEGGNLLIKKVQPPNKGKMDAYSYVNGYKIGRGKRFE